MAAEQDVAVKEVKLTDLDDVLMQKWLCKMSVTEQTAVTRVCKRFKANAYKLTAVMFVSDTEDGYSRWLETEVIPKLPKLKKLCFTIPWITTGPPSKDTRLRLFLKFVASHNPKIERITGLHSVYKRYFVEMAKLHHKDYDEATFKSLIAEKQYEELMKEHPGIKIRHVALFRDDTLSERTMAEKLSDPNLAALGVSTEIPNYNFYKIVTLTKNLTHLTFRQEALLKYSVAHIFDAVVSLPLKNFTFQGHTTKIRDWVERDFESFRRLLELNSLVYISLSFEQGNNTYRKILECFLNCSRNNFHHFSSHMLNAESNFQPHELDPQLFPSMHLKLRGNDDTFPIVRFIQKFSPKYREFDFEDGGTMVKMIKACTDLIKNQPKFHFVFYANRGRFSFRPFQLQEGKIKILSIPGHQSSAFIIRNYELFSLYGFDK